MPGFIKTQEDEKIWKKAKNLTKKRGISKKNTNSFYAYTNSIFQKIKNGKKNENKIDHEKNYMTSFKTWFNKIDKTSSTDKFLTKIKKNKFDTTLEKPDVKGNKKHTVTVWGAPSSYDYIRG